jgi:hypothetical protein
MRVIHCLVLHQKRPLPLDKVKVLLTTNPLPTKPRALPRTDDFAVQLLPFTASICFYAVEIYTLNSLYQRMSRDLVNKIWQVVTPLAVWVVGRGLSNGSAND